MKTVAVIQARMGSSRLPGKVLMDLCGETMLSRVIRRTVRASGVEKVVVATTTSLMDDPIEDDVKPLGVEVYRGSEDDVLDRYFHATERYSDWLICRITADCPLIDPVVIGETIRSHIESGADYTSNTLVRSFPRGLDVEVFSRENLEIAWREATKPHEREHVTPFFFQNSERFLLKNLIAERDFSGYRWTVDVPEDFEAVRRIYEAFEGRNTFSWVEALNIVESRPDWFLVNSRIEQKAMERK